MLEMITHLMRPASQPYEAGRFVVIPSLFSYQSGTGAQAYIEGGERSFVVSDGGGAIREFISAGGGDDARKHLNAAKAYGLEVSQSGWIFRSGVCPEELTGWVPMIIEQSIAADNRLRRAHARKQAAVHFKERVNEIIRLVPSIKASRGAHATGASLKKHLFDFGLEINGKTLVIDAVVQDANAINSAIVSHLDVSQAHNPNVIQRIVYDDTSPWKTADLALLGVGAPTLPAGSLASQLQRLAA
ncbi:hypothetical protein sos41_21730 [Alphaproteobacteria bacterium SO-S41]|nr:hypothetical protein sos41_21730 [Alphaproteobacteria bacterium SO-S41]